MYTLTVKGKLQLEPAKAPGRTMMSIRGGKERNEIADTSVSMSRLADMLSRELQRMVVDHTKLEGEFDFKLDAPREDSANPLAARQSAAIGQVGLALLSQKGPVEMLIIERAEHPREN